MRFGLFRGNHLSLKVMLSIRRQNSEVKVANANDILRFKGCYFSAFAIDENTAMSECFKGGETRVASDLNHPMKIGGMRIIRMNVIFRVTSDSKVIGFEHQMR